MSKNTNWKNLGRKQGANMKNFRNMKADKMMYNDGKWTTVYSDDDIKRLAYYNIDLPHVVGIGTNTPFSRLSFGDSSNCGDHVSGILNPGKLASLALHEKTIQEEGLGVKKGQEFNGLGYVTNLRSVRSNINNKDANGVGIFSNKFISATDSSQKTDKAIMYITDDKHVQIGGVPTGYNLIDRRNGSSFISTTQETGPNIILDVSGSIHINGFINFLKNGADSTIKQKNDNPANQLTLNTGVEPSRIELCDSVDQAKTDNRAVPEGAIFVGFDKDANSDFLVTIPRLYIMVNGIQKRIATEDDKSFYEDNNSGFTFTGNNALDGGKRTYVFRNPGDQPGNTLINTFSGIMGDDFDGVGVGGRNLPQTYNGVEFSSETSALQVLGNISVFDSKYGGTDLSPLNTGNLEKARLILVTEIYDTTSSTGRELGTIYTDRHIMIGGQKYSSGNKPNLTFDYFGSAIDISGGITGKPAIRLISGGNKGSIKVSNPTDSIIIGNTPSVNFKTMNKECILVGENTKYENNVNTLVMGKDNNVTRTKNSLIVGNNLDVSFNNVTEGVVALGVGGTDGITIGGNERIVFATNDGTSSMKALTIDKDGNVTIIGNLNVQGDEIILDVEHKVVEDSNIDLGGRKEQGVAPHNTVSAGTLSGEHTGGIKLFIHEDGDDNHFIKWSFDESNNTAGDYNTANPPDHISTSTDGDRWTTAMSSRRTGIAAAAETPETVDTERFKVLSSGDLKISSDGTTNNDKFTVQASSGNTVVEGSLTVNNAAGIILQNDETITNANDGTVLINGDVAAGTGSAAGVFKSNGDQDVILKTGNSTTGSITITNGAAGNITLAPNGSGDVNLETDTVKIGDTNTNATITTNGTGDLTLNTNSGSNSGSITIEDGTTGHIKIIPKDELRIFDQYAANSKGAVFKKQSGNNKVDLEISGKLTVDGLIDPTGLILDSASAPSDDDVNNKLGLYFESGKLKFKTKATDGTVTTSEVAVGSSTSTGGSSGGGGGGGGSGLNAIVTEIDSNVDNLITLTGISENVTNLGTFSGSTISDSVTIKAALQALESSVETKQASGSYATTTVVNEIDSNVDNLITLTGISENVTNLGTFSGSTISDSVTIKAALQALETSVETKAPINNPTFTGTVTVNDITMTKGSDRKIEVAESDTDGHNLTLKAGDGKTDNGRNGGNLNLNAGNGTTANQGSGTPGNIYLNPGSGNTTGIVEIGAGGGLNSVLQSASSKGLKIKSQANDIELQPTSNLIFNTSTIQVPKDKSCTLEIASQTISNDGKSFTISAGGSFGTNKNGGNLNLNGGAASTGTASNTKKGDVNINGDNVNITGNKIELNGTVTSTTNTNLVLTGSDSKPQIIMNGPFVSKINKLVNLWEEDKIVDITAQNLINGLFISLQKTAFNTSTHPDTCGLRLPAPWKVCDLFENVGAEGIIFEFYVEHMVSWNLRIRTHENTNDITTTNSRNGETNQGKWIYTGRLGSANSFGPSVWESGDTKYGPMYNILGDEAGGYNGKKNVFDGNGGWTGIANETDNGTIIDSLYSGPRGYLEVKNSFFQKFICRIESAGYSSNNTKENAAIVIYTSNNNMNANNGVDSKGTSSI